MSASWTTYQCSRKENLLHAVRSLMAVLSFSICSSSAIADYTGLNAVITENIDIDGVIYQSVDLYVGLTDPEDRIWAVTSEQNSPLILSAPGGGFYQSPLGGTTPHSSAFDELFGDSVRYDSFVTIGADTDDPCCTMLLGFDVEAFDQSDQVIISEGLWGVLPESTLAGLGAGSNHGVLIGRFTFRSDQTMSGRLNFMGRLADGTTWSASNVTFSYGLDANQRPDFIGETAGERYGTSMVALGDIDGDAFHDFAVGAPFYTTANGAVGAVYIYSGNSGNLLHRFEGIQHNSRFGWALAHAGDMNGDDIADLMVGAPRADYIDEDSGRVDFISGADGQLLARIYGEHEGDRFGSSVAGPRLDVTGSDYRLLVGAPNHDTVDRQAGRVYILDSSSNQLNTIDGIAKGDRFGWSLSFVGDINGDAINDFAIGSPRNDDKGSNSGRVDLYDGTSYETLQTLYGEKVGSRFGAYIAGYASLDDDAEADFFVGATHFDRSAAKKAGRLYAYSGKYGTKLWHKTGDTANERSGSFIGIAEDLDCDGYTDVIVGSPRYSLDGLSKTGRIMIRSGHNGTLVSSQTGTQVGSFFGASSCVLHDQGEIATILTGASRFTVDDLPDAGRVLELTLNECGATSQALLRYGAVQLSDPAENNAVGLSLNDTMQYYIGDILNLPIDRPYEAMPHSD